MRSALIDQGAITLLKGGSGSSALNLNAAPKRGAGIELFQPLKPLRQSPKAGGPGATANNSLSDALRRSRRARSNT